MSEGACHRNPPLRAVQRSTECADHQRPRTTFDPGRVPTAICERAQWVCWKYIDRDGKPTKCPIDARTGRPASSTDPSTWCSFEKAVEALLQHPEYAGVGFVFCDDDPYTGIDLDACLDGDGNLVPAARRLVEEFDTYTEISPSRRGVKLIIVGEKPKGSGCRSKKVEGYEEIEIYSRARYFAITGCLLEGAPETIEQRQDQLDALCQKLWPKKESACLPRSRATGAGFDGDDDALIEAACGAHNGDRFHRLWDGDTSMHGDDDSAADLALCCMLAFWTACEADRIDRLFRRSGLYREKWERQDYSERTIERAIESTTDVYGRRTWGGGDGVTPNGSINPSVDDSGIVVNNRQLSEVTKDSERVLISANDPPVVFKRNKTLVRIDRDDDERPTIGGVGVDELRHRLGQCARFIKIGRDSTINVFPPIGVVKNILAAGLWEFPPLAGIVEVPVMRPDGSILDAPGYDPATRLYFQPAPSLTIPRIPHRPSHDHVVIAARLIDEILMDFPFVRDDDGEDYSASRANACAMVFEPVVRPVIEGRSPVGVANAHTAGSGKTLFSSVVSTIATGRPAAVFSAPTREEEWRKQITSALLGGNAVIVIDNIVEPLESPSLAAAITAPIWAARRLGVSEDVEIPVRVTWIGTGNNVRLGGDLPRRCYWVCLDPPTDRPWEREGFKHPELLHWVLKHRGEIVAAILTIARAWHVAGRPGPGPVLGSFEPWSRVLSGMLEVAGIPGFLENREAMLAKADDEGPAWRAFLSAWRTEFNERPVTVGEVARRLEESRSTTDDPDFWELLPGDLLDSFDLSGARRSSLTRRLGKALSKIEGKRFDANGLRVGRYGQEKRAIRWKVVIDASG